VTVQELLEILNNRDEIPSPEYAELCFYLTKSARESLRLQP